MQMTTEDWKKEPWRCPGCRCEKVMTRNLMVPGGSPENVRRETDVTWECRCTQCDLHWRVVFVPQIFYVATKGSARAEPRDGSKN